MGANGISSLIEQLAPAERLALAYAPRALQNAYRDVLLLDAHLRRTVTTGREPALVQLKLAWWRDALAPRTERQEHPLLQALAHSWQGHPIGLSSLVDAWEEFAAGETAMLKKAEAVAGARARMFAAVACHPVDADLIAAAHRWTLVDLAPYARDAAVHAAMLAEAGRNRSIRLSRELRPLAVLDGLAHRAARRGSDILLGDRLSPFAALRLGIFGR